MIERIKNIEPYEKVEKIGNTQYPTILYGASQAAALSCDFLAARGINMDAVVVDSGFLAGNETLNFRGRPVQAIEDFIDSHSRPVNLVIGFYSKNIQSLVYKKLTRFKKLGLNVVNVVLLDHHLLMYPERAFTFNYVQSHLKDFEQTYNLLADDRSRDVMVAFINQRISAQIGELERVRDDNQYFLPSVVKLTDNEVYVDCGAYDGDTVFEFLDALQKQTGQRDYGRIYALECNPATYPLLLDRIGHLANVSCMDKGAWDCDATCLSMENLERSSCLTQNGKFSVRVSRLDDMLDTEEGCTFIKMDIEGAELQALRGAESTIRQESPKLAICVYHKNDDLLTIPRYLHSINPRYSFYLRAHESKSGEVVLYAL